MSTGTPLPTLPLAATTGLTNQEERRALLLWLVTGGRVSSGHAERRAEQLVAATFVLLAVYLAIESSRDLIGRHHPRDSSAR